MPGLGIKFMKIDTSNTKIIITGGAGFIGTNLAYSAIQKGITAVIFDNLSRKGSHLNLKKILEQGKEKIIFFKGDIRSTNDIENLINYHSDAIVIFHLAAQVAVTTSVIDPEEDFSINAFGSFKLLETLRTHNINIPVIYTSTNKVYGSLKNIKVSEGKFGHYFTDLDHGISENFQLDFHSPYGCSKGAADQYFLDYSRIYGLKTIVFRQSCIYGQHQLGIEDQGWVAWFTIAALYDKPITIYGDGKQTRDILYIDDLIEAYWLSIEDVNKTQGHVYNIGGGGHKASLLELISFLEKKLNKKLKIQWADARPGDQLVFVSDIQKAKEHFGWVPKTNMDEGISKLLSWAKLNKNLFLKAGII